MPFLMKKSQKSCRTWPTSAAIIITGVLTLSGCTTTTVQTFNANQNSNVEASYVATDADFGKYTQLRSEEAGIFFPEDQPVPAADLRRIRQIFREAFLDELTAYQIVENPGPAVMTVQASIIDLRNADITDVPDMRTGLDDVARPGVLVFMMEMRDSESGRVLARAADSTANPRIGNSSGRATDWRDVQTSAEHWASLFRQFLDQNFSH